MFEYRPNLSARAQALAEKERRRLSLKKDVASSKTLRKLRETLIRAMEEGDL